MFRSRDFENSDFTLFFDESQHVQERSNSTTTMPPKKTNRFPLRTANERGSAETIRASIGHGTLSLASRITTIERLSPRVLPEAEMDNNSDPEPLINDESDHCETNDAENDDNDDVGPHAPLQPNILLADVVEQQRATVERQERMIEFLVQQNTELLSPRESRSKNDQFDMTNPRRYCGGAHKSTPFSALFAQTSVLTPTTSPTARPTKSSMRSITWEAGATTAIIPYIKRA
jgi:hypothetical protein